MIVSHRDAGWLPRGGRADVVLADGDTAVPDPTCVVRLFATRDGRVLTVARADGGGPDLPTLAIDGGDVEATLRMLLLRTLGTVRPASMLGYVRNVVADPPDDYPWPSPYAHFVVWHCHVPADLDPVGVWLERTGAETHLGTRHWWPLAAQRPWLDRGMGTGLQPS
jgi:hypothetical protein